MAYAGSQFHQGPGYLNDPLKPFGPPVSYCNTEQSVTLTCPEGTEGDPVTGTVPADTYCGYPTQEEANAVALAAAQAIAEQMREENPCTLPGNTLWGWGHNDGALGVGTYDQQDAPVIIGYSSLDWVDVSTGLDFSLAIKNDGTLWAWGGNYEGQLGLGTISTNPVTDNHDELYPVQVGTDSDWAVVDCGQQCSAAIKRDGTLWTWGYNGSGQLGHGDTTSRLVPVQVGTDTDWADIQATGQHMIGLKTDGTIWGSGNNSQGQLGVGSFVSSSVFLQAGTDTDWVSISVSKTVGQNQQNSGAIKSNGTLWGWGPDWWTFPIPDNVPTQIFSDTDWQLQVAGRSFVIGLKTDGTLWSAGLNTSGQCGIGNVDSPVADWTQIGTDTDWSSVSCGQAFAVAQKTDGTLWGWGDNGYGQLGQGIPSGANPSPIQMGSDGEWSALYAGSFDTIALRSTLTPPAPPPDNNGVASGGTYTIDGLYSVHTFSSVNTFYVYQDTLMDFLVVGGGGGGGGLGGGGGGQVQKLTGVLVEAGTYEVVVGPKALRAFGGEDRGEDGATSTFNGTTAIGGGGGAAGLADTDEDATGANGASGGGGGMRRLTPFAVFLGGIGSDGGNGGDAYSDDFSGKGAGGGGGGASGDNGGDATSVELGTGGNGAAGLSDSINGSAVIYGAGGGGGGFGDRGIGGSSVGGSGAVADDETIATNATTPGSGGGGGYKNVFSGILIDEGAGASDGAYGVVIMRYLTPT